MHKGEILATVNTDDEGRFTVVGSKDLDDLEDDKLRVYLEISSNCDKEQRVGGWGTGRTGRLGRL